MQEVLLSLSYLPSAERLTVVLLKARNLFRPSAKYSIGALSAAATQFPHLLTISLGAFVCVGRSLRESLPADRRQADEEEENRHQERELQPRVERGAHFQRLLRAPPKCCH